MDYYTTEQGRDSVATQKTDYRYNDLNEFNAQISVVIANHLAQYEPFADIDQLDTRRIIADIWKLETDKLFAEKKPVLTEKHIDKVKQLFEVKAVQKQAEKRIEALNNIDGTIYMSLGEALSKLLSFTKGSAKSNATNLIKFIKYLQGETSEPVALIELANSKGGQGKTLRQNALSVFLNTEAKELGALPKDQSLHFNTQITENKFRITKDFARYPLCICSEFTPSKKEKSEIFDTLNNIIDRDFYATDEKFKQSIDLQSITAVFGATNTPITYENDRRYKYITNINIEDCFLKFYTPKTYDRQNWTDDQIEAERQELEKMFCRPDKAKAYFLPYYQAWATLWHYCKYYNITLPNDTEADETPVDASGELANIIKLYFETQTPDIFGNYTAKITDIYNYAKETHRKKYTLEFIKKELKRLQLPKKTDNHAITRDIYIFNSVLIDDLTDAEQIDKIRQNYKRICRYCDQIKAEVKKTKAETPQYTAPLYTPEKQAKINEAEAKKQTARTGNDQPSRTDAEATPPPQLEAPKEPHQKTTTTATPLFDITSPEAETEQNIYSGRGGVIWKN